MNTVLFFAHTVFGEMNAENKEKYRIFHVGRLGLRRDRAFVARTHPLDDDTRRRNLLYNYFQYSGKVQKAFCCL